MIYMNDRSTDGFSRHCYRRLRGLSPIRASCPQFRLPWSRWITFSRVPAPFSLQSHISTCAASAVSRILMLQGRAERRGFVSSLGLTFARRISTSRVSSLSAFHPLLTTVSSFSLLFALPENLLPTSRNDWLDFVCTDTFLIAGFARGLSRCMSADGPFCSCSAYLARLTVFCAPGD